MWNRWNISTRKRDDSSDADNRMRITTDEKENVQPMEIMNNVAVAKSVDLISQLPVQIIHHILSLLPTPADAARTSILSRTWRDIWTSFPSLYFNHDIFLKGCRDTQVIMQMTEVFIDFVDLSLHRFAMQECSLQKMVLRTWCVNSDIFSHIDRWIGIALEKNVEELTINIFSSSLEPLYHIPSTVFCSATVTSITLSGCVLILPSSTEFPSLKKLCLVQLTHVSDIDTLISCCPMIEELELFSCRGIKALNVSNLLKLEKICVCFEFALGRTYSINVQTPNLHSFSYSGPSLRHFRLAAKTLKSLSLSGVDIDQSFLNVIQKFNSLEKLFFSSCRFLTHFKISNPELMELGFACNKLLTADIHTPKLLSFVYIGTEMHFLNFDPSFMKEVKITLFNMSDQRLKEILQRFSCFGGFKLVVHSESSDKDIFIDDDLRDVLLPPFLKFKLDIVKSLRSTEDFLEELLKCSRPVKLWTCSKEITETIIKKFVKRKKVLNCCTHKSSSTKCWQHFLEHVEIDDSTAHIDTVDFPIKMWNRWIKSRATLFPTGADDANKMWNNWIKSCASRKPICFKLNWKPKSYRI